MDCPGQPIWSGASPVSAPVSPITAAAGEACQNIDNTTTINVINIDEFIDFIANHFYFNTYNNSLYINIGGMWIEFCPCGIGSGSGSESGSGGDGPPVETTCCPGVEIPSVLHATISDTSCWSNPITLTYDPIGIDWTSGPPRPGWHSETLACHPAEPKNELCVLMIYCSDGLWACRLGRKAEEDFQWGFSEVGPSEEVTCDPFLASFIQDDTGDCNLTSPFTIVVSE